MQRHSNYTLQRHYGVTTHGRSTTWQRHSGYALQRQAGQQVSPKTAASWCSWTPGRVSCIHSFIAAAVAEAEACISSASAHDFSHLHGMQVYHKYHAARQHARICKTLQEQQQRRLKSHSTLWGMPQGKCHSLILAIDHDPVTSSKS